MLTLMRRRMQALLRGSGRWLDSSRNVEDISIGELIGPLRYDVLALRDVLRFYVDHQEQADADFTWFVGEVRRLRFYDWKFASHSIREPETTQSAAVFDPVFAAEVRQVLEVWEALRGGFDPRQPIEVRVTDRLLPSASGKRLRARYVLGDGSHRLACLMVRGFTVLPRDHYRLRWFRAWQPFDATGILTRQGLLSEAEYCGFLSEVLGAPPLQTRAEVIAFLAAAYPERVAEIREVMAVDGFPIVS